MCFCCPPSFLNKIDLLEEKLKSGICFNKYVTSYGSRKNDVPSVTFCKVFEVFTAVYD